MSEDRAWRHADTRYRTAEINALEAALAALPVGRFVKWVHGEHERMGSIQDVAGHNYHCLRVKVLSVGGRAQWIYANRILEEL